ncbi:glycosyltransferase family 4 protein [Schleiferiaceae bacterium]|nr:glycosyltransferase family 4 protein [Schleiferiaceae bacterium]
MEVRKKVLIMGQIPKEFGGTYTTGVGNVIVSYLNEMDSNAWSCAMFASNLRGNDKTHTLPYMVYGISLSTMVKGFVLWLFNGPSVGCRIKYYKRFGVSWKKGLVHEWILSEILRRENPNIIHVHNSGLYPVIKAFNLTKPVILTFHGIFSSDEHSIAENMARGIDLKKLMTGIGMNAPEKVTVLTQSMKVQVVEELGILRDKIHVISNGINQFFFYDLDARLSLRREMSIDVNDYLFISVGALTKRKNHIAAIEFLRNSQLKYTYIIIGKDGDHSSQVRELASEEPSVRLIEYVDNSELYRYYSASDAFILPSTKEGQALVALEALACGLPVIVNQDIFDSLDCPKSFNDSLYAVNMSRTMDDVSFTKLKTAERKILSKKSISEFSWKEISKLYMDLYEKAF